jgi:hypothetical protein
MTNFEYGGSLSHQEYSPGSIGLETFHPATPNAVPRRTLRYNGREEYQLKRDFAGLVEDIDIKDVLMLQPNRNIPKNIGNYRLVPITSVEENIHSSKPAEIGIKLPGDVRCNFREPGGTPWLDSSLGIGLAYKDELRALAAGGLAPDGHLNIVQLQVVDFKASDPKLKYKSGLHNGFFWRDTLVMTWMKIAEAVDVGSVEIQGAVNNRWVSDSRLNVLMQGYDGVAERMGFALNNATNNWLAPPRD